MCVRLLTSCKYMKTKCLEIKEEKEKSITIVGYFNIMSLSFTEPVNKTSVSM